MAIEMTNECVDCGKPCMGEFCPNRHVKRFYCDECDNETTIYRYDGKDWCVDCLLQEIGAELIEGSDGY